jgi:hypothetical protein
MFRRIITLGIVAFCLIGSSLAHAGDWVVESNRDITTAITRNSNGSALGYACSRASDECLFFFTPNKLKCTEGSHYTVLINGGNHNNSQSTVCRRLGAGDGHEFANVFENSNDLRKQLLNADDSTIGIARGTGSDEFTVSKFGMRGFQSAFDKVNRQRGERGDRNDRNDRNDR